MNHKAKHEAVFPDRISELPDGILCHILSFIPTLYSVRTTVLSKTWNKLWTFVPNINLGESYFYRPSQSEKPTYGGFLTFVDRVLSLRTSSDIQKFRLQFPRDVIVKEEDFPRIHRWICTAIRSNVAELDISFFGHTISENDYVFQLGYDSEEGDDVENEERYILEFKMPQIVFTSQSLVSMKVESDCITYTPTTPGCFPRLKFLHVSTYNLVNRSMENIFSYCPVLEDLTIGGYFREQVLNFKIYSPELRKFTTDWDYQDEVDHMCSFFIDAPKLGRVQIDGDRLSNLVFHNSSSVVRAKMCISMKEGYICPNYDDHVTTFLAGISCVKYLSLLAPHFDEYFVPAAFNNLSTLVFTLHDCDYWDLLIEFLNRSPNLEVLSFGIRWDLWTDTYMYENICKDFRPPEIVPGCLLTRVKTIVMKEFMGEDNDMIVVKYFLKHCQVLDRMIIRIKFPLFCRPKKLYEELLPFRNSENCKIEIL